MACYFVGGAQIDFKGVALLVVCRFGAVAGVDIDYVKSLGVFDDYISSRFEGYGLSERRLNLFGDVEVVENRFVFSVKFHYILSVGCNQADIFRHLIVGLGIIDIDAFK